LTCTCTYVPFVRRHLLLIPKLPFICRYIRSLSRCRPWEAKGGKSGSTFCKTEGKTEFFSQFVYYYIHIVIFIYLLLLLQ